MDENTKSLATSHVLIIEDDESQQHTLKSILEGNGFDVLVCSRATEALGQLDAQSITVAIVDLKLPDCSPEQLLRDLDPWSDRVSFIIHTDYCLCESAVSAVNLRAFAYLEKPSAPEELVGLVHRAMHYQLRRYSNELETIVTQRTRELEQRSELPELFFNQALDGCFFMMLDEPVRWDSTVDKDNILDYVFAQQRITKVNDAMRSQYGASKDQLTGMTPSDFFADNIAQGQDLWRHLFDTGRLFTETDERRLDGKRMWIEGEYICLYDDEGRITGHFGIQRDITERKEHAEFEAIVMRLSHDFVRCSSHDLDLTIQSALQSIGRFCQVDRAYVFLLSDDAVHVSNTHEYCADEIHSQIDKLQNIALDTDLPWFARQIRSLKTVIVASVEDLPFEAQLEKEHFNMQGIQSLIVVPVVMKQQLLGFLGLGCVSSKRHWGFRDSAPLQLFGEILANAIARQRTEADLWKSEERFRYCFELAAVGIANVAPNGHFLRINRRFCNIVGYTHDQMISSTFQAITHPDDLEIDLALVQRVLAGEIKTYTLEKRYIHKQGKTVWVNLTVSLVRTHSGDPDYFISVVEDISTRKLAEQELQQYQIKLKAMATELTLSEERLKRTIATELHDRISQSLAISKMKLTALLQESSANTRTQAILTDISESLKQTLIESRELTSELSYPTLAILGLEKTIDIWLREEIGDKHGLKTNFEDDGQDKPVSEDIQAVLFRGARELLTNIVKHAQADQVDVCIGRHNKDIVVSVSDDGIGFDIGGVMERGSGFGLLSLKESFERLGGTFHIESTPGFGCKTTLNLPLDAERIHQREDDGL